MNIIGFIIVFKEIVSLKKRLIRYKADAETKNIITLK
jgi:hypothetical protein